MAGLVGGDSDSSALTQESGDEGVAETPRESVVTGTDAGTEEPEEEDTEMREPSPGTSYLCFLDGTGDITLLFRMTRILLVVSLTAPRTKPKYQGRQAHNARPRCIQIYQKAQAIMAALPLSWPSYIFITSMITLLALFDWF